MAPKLEWDENKRQKVFQERGLDFADLARFDWDGAETYQDNRKDYGEVRRQSYGRLQGRVVSVVWCEREQTKRIISLRKANQREVVRYERYEKSIELDL